MSIDETTSRIVYGDRTSPPRSAGSCARPLWVCFANLLMGYTTLGALLVARPQLTR